MRLFHFRVKIPHKNNNPNGPGRAVGVVGLTRERRAGVAVAYADSGL